MLLSFACSFIAIGILAIIHQFALSHTSDPRHVLVIPPWGAAAVLLCAASGSPLAQPRNLILGNLLAGIVGVALQRIFLSLPELYWVKCALSVACTILAQQLTKSVHPPGCAVALAAASDSSLLVAVSWWFLLTPVLFACAIFLIVTIILMNIRTKTKYPRFWL